MKKIIYILLCFCILFSSSACSGSDKKQDYVTFYYGRQHPTFDDSNGVLAQEKHPANKYNDLSSLIAGYLQGPEDPAQLCLLPPETMLTDIEQSDNTLQIVLSKECANMSEIDLVVTCSCLAKTIQPLTNAEQIIITTEEGFTHLDGPLMFTADSILTEDLVQMLD